MGLDNVENMLIKRNLLEDSILPQPEKKYNLAFCATILYNHTYNQTKVTIVTNLRQVVPYSRFIKSELGIFWVGKTMIESLKRMSIIIFVVTLASCAIQGDKPPTIEILSPQSGIEVRLGERVLVQSIAQDDKKVVKTELWVNGRLYQVDRPSKNTGGQSFDVIQIWDAPSVGTHSLVVKAHNIDGLVSVPDSVTVEVLPPLPTPVPMSTTFPVIDSDPTCQLSARFVEDVTVPDDSLYNSGVKFTKTWRLRNDGECRWEEETEWVFISGNMIGAQSPVKVELAEPDRIVDISVEMVAPPAPGTYQSYWRLRRANGEFFGDQAYVRIIVP